MFASKTRKDVEFGDDRVTIKKLNWSTLERAREVRQQRSATTIKTFGGEVFKVLRSESAANLAEQIKTRQEDPEAARKARYEEYNKGVVLHEGIVAWTFGEKLSAEAVDDLDEDIARRVFEEIIDLSAPRPEAEAKG